MKAIRHIRQHYRSLVCPGYEEVVLCTDPARGLKAIIAIHDRRLGPAMGGCRMWSYGSESEALIDALRLARGMTFKAALANVSFGGGKSVIMGDPKSDKSEALLHAFGRFVDSFRGRYYTGEDVGTSVEDMTLVAEETPYVVGRAGASGDPSPVAAFGVYLGIRTALGHAFETDQVLGRRVAVQGLGHVGYDLCMHLAGDRANLVVADIDPAAVKRACEDFGAAAVVPNEI